MIGRQLVLLGLMALGSSVAFSGTSKKAGIVKKEIKIRELAAKKFVFAQFDTIQKDEISEDIYEELDLIFDEFPLLTEVKDERGWTLLHEAAHCGHLEMAEFLIRKGADCYAQTDGLGDTPLHLAARVHAWDIICLLYFEYEMNEELNDLIEYPFDHDCPLCPLKQLDLNKKVLQKMC